MQDLHLEGPYDTFLLPRVVQHKNPINFILDCALVHDIIPGIDSGKFIELERLLSNRFLNVYDSDQIIQENA